MDNEFRKRINMDELLLKRASISDDEWKKLLIQVQECDESDFKPVTDIIVNNKPNTNGGEDK